ncbi:MAG: division/cell wall cluster transcriptional repressor MraZ [Pirellulales bacterium]|nr:division/cell wall cluster transcriptional repressor MraZ [Pirellulales bacterium]
MLLTGSYRRALDDKQRLAIPKPLREQFARGQPLYLTPGLDGCLAVYPMPAFEALADRLAASSPAAREVRSYSRLFYSQAASVVPDSQWRFRLTPELVKWASLESDLVVVGVRDHIEIWAAENWQSYVQQCDGQYEKLAESALNGGALRGASGAPEPSPHFESDHHCDYSDRIIARTPR